jgi:hypothetical protein
MTGEPPCGRSLSHNFNMTKNYPHEADFSLGQTSSICSQENKFSKIFAGMQAKILSDHDLFENNDFPAFRRIQHRPNDLLIGETLFNRTRKEFSFTGCGIKCQPLIAKTDKQNRRDLFGEITPLLRLLERVRQRFSQSTCLPAARQSRTTAAFCSIGSTTRTASSSRLSISYWAIIQKLAAF